MKPILYKKKNYFTDVRGAFYEMFKKKKYSFESIFTAFSISKKNVIRGLHYQEKKKQKILLFVLKGRILDVCVDVRKNSKNFGKVYKNYMQQGDALFVPENFLHGFAAYDAENILLYHFSNYRDKKSEIGVSWNDVTLNIDWKIRKPILSNKDKNNLSFKNFLEKNKVE
jgi:dTDP-4-dehydrorhamnose 3,5-epimerase